MQSRPWQNNWLQVSVTAFTILHTVVLISLMGLLSALRLVLPPLPFLEIVFKHDFFFLPRVAVVAAVILEPTEALPPAGFCSGWALGWTTIQFI